MKISLVTDTFLPEVNGVTTVLSVMRAGLRQRGVAVQVIAPSYPEGGTPDEHEVVRRVSVPCPGYPQVRLSWAWGGGVTDALRAFRPDVVHAITEGPIGMVGRGWALRGGIPLVTSFHTDFPAYAVRYLGAWSEPWAVRFLRRFHAAAAHTQTPSEEVAARLRRLGVPNVQVWGRGVDTGMFRADRRDDARRAADGVAGKVHVLHVGRLAREKDVETVVAAFQRARAALGDRAIFTVAGDGPRAAWVREQLPFARHLGFLKRQVLADLYADADLFVFPSRTETCGLVALEAMASGLPVVTADEGGVLENVRPGQNGLACPAGDAEAFSEAIVRLAADAPQRATLAGGALRFAAARSWEAELDALVPLYAGAVGASNGRAPTFAAWPAPEPSSSPPATTAAPS